MTRPVKTPTFKSNLAVDRNCANQFRRILSACRKLTSNIIQKIHYHVCENVIVIFLTLTFSSYVDQTYINSNATKRIIWSLMSQLMWNDKLILHI